MTHPTPKAPPLSQVLDQAERRPTLTPPEPRDSVRAGEVLALVVGFVGGVVVGGATLALLPIALLEDVAERQESRVMVPLEKCIAGRRARP